MPVQRINHFINASDQLRQLVSQAQRLDDLTRVLSTIAPPPLAQACRATKLCSGTLYLLAENGAVAAKLKQLVPRLLTAYGKLGGEVTSIHIEVQVTEREPEHRRHSKERALSIDSIEHLRKLAASMEESPLKEAVTRLASRGGSKNN